MLRFIKISAAIFFVVLMLGFSCYAIESGDVSATCAVLLDADSGEILFEKSAHKVRSMASTTKIMTSLLAIESGKLSFTVTAEEKIYIEGTAIGIDKGDKMSLRTLVYAMLLESGNDAAVLTAEYLAGSEEAFSVMMNEKASRLGMLNTNFVTASGLDDENHYTTAYDMALLGAYAVKNPVFRQICSQKSHKAEFVVPDVTRTFSNHNRLLDMYDGVFGIKTGFTKKSGRCLVSACERSGKILVAVTLNAPDDWNDHIRMYDYGYSIYERTVPELTVPSKVYVAGSERRYVSIGLCDEVSDEILCLDKLSSKVYLKSILYAPVLKGDIVGEVLILSVEKTVKFLPVYALEDAPKIEGKAEVELSLKQKILNYIKNIFTSRKEK